MIMCKIKTDYRISISNRTVHFENRKHRSVGGQLVNDCGAVIQIRKSLRIWYNFGSSQASFASELSSKVPKISFARLSWKNTIGQPP